MSGIVHYGLIVLGIIIGMGAIWSAFLGEKYAVYSSLISAATLFYGAFTGASLMRHTVVMIGVLVSYLFWQQAEKARKAKEASS